MSITSGITPTYTTTGPVGATGPTGPIPTPNYVYSFNASPIGAASTLSFAASAITMQTTGVFHVSVTCCPVPNTIPTEITLQIYKDGYAIPTIVQKTAPVGIGNDSLCHLECIDVVTDTNPHIYSILATPGVGNLSDGTGHCQILVMELV